MIMNLADTVFVNDMFSTQLPNGNYILLNLVNESFAVEGVSTELAIKAINIEVVDTDGNSISCPCVIGLGNEYMIIKTDYTQYEGEVLTPDNMAYCTIEVYD